MKAATKKKVEHIQLLEGCYCSQFTVHPSNWDQAGADPDCTWYINYRFYDPAYKDHPKFKKGKQVIVKGMNSFVTLRDKRKATIDLQASERHDIIDKGYNPIRKAFMTREEKEPVPIRTAAIMPEDGLWRGIVFARTMKEMDGDYQPETMVDIDSYLRRILKAAAELGMHTIPLKEFRRRHLLTVMHHIGQKKTWGLYAYNNCLGYLGGLFTYLNKYEAMEVNPVEGIDKKVLPEPDREVLDDLQRKAVDERLKRVNRRFWLFVNMFYHSGARIIEFLRVQRPEDVDLINQTFTVTTRKGKGSIARRQVKPIKDVALPFWLEYLSVDKPGKFLFCKGFLPGDKHVTRWWIDHLWKRLVMNEMGFDATIYSLKYSNLDEISAMADLETAAASAGHADTKMVKKHYAVKEKQRRLDKVRKLPNTFA